jgi:hemerythrin-like domain-containing protein
MKLVDDLGAEHRLIEQVVGALRTFVDGPGGPEADRRAFLDFFQRYAGDFHHAREEEVLFAALAREAGLPLDRGPMSALARDHRDLAALLAEYGQRGERALAHRYADGLLHHLDAEDSVLFPEAVERLRRVNVKELDGRGPTGAELAARADGEGLVARYPPSQNRDLLRGEGCVLCPSYGVSCEGLERTWWTQSEWDEVGDRFSGD